MDSNGVVLPPANKHLNTRASAKTVFPPYTSLSELLSLLAVEEELLSEVSGAFSNSTPHLSSVL